MLGRFKVILDANALLIPGEFRVDVFTELGNFGRPVFCTLNLVIGELEKIAEGRGKDSGSAKLALRLLRENQVQVLAAEGKNTDLEILKVARRGNFAVLTQDRALIRKLKEKGVPVLTLRQKKYLVKA